MHEAKPRIIVRTSEHLTLITATVPSVIAIESGDNYATYRVISDGPETTFHARGLNHKIIQFLSENPGAHGATKLSQELSVSVGAVRSAIARIRAKGCPIENTHGLGFCIRSHTEATYFKKLCNRLVRLLLDQHKEAFIDEFGHAMPMPLSLLQEGLGVGRETAKSVINRARARLSKKKVAAIKNIRGAGFYIDIPKGAIIVQK